MDTPVPGAGSQRLVDSKPNKLGYAVRFFNPLKWVLDLIADGEAIDGLLQKINAPPTTFELDKQPAFFYHTCL